MRLFVVFLSVAILSACAHIRPAHRSFAYHHIYTMPLGWDIFKNVPGVPKTVRYTGFANNKATFEQSYEKSREGEDGSTYYETIKKPIIVEPFAGDSTALIEGVKLKFLKVDNEAITFKTLDYPLISKREVLEQAYGLTTLITFKNQKKASVRILDEDEASLTVQAVLSPTKEFKNTDFVVGSKHTLLKADIESLSRVE